MDKEYESHPPTADSIYDEGEEIMGCPKCGHEWPAEEGPPCPNCGY